MNKMIQELMEKAKAEVRSEEEIEGIACNDFDAQVMEKFAELIVQECVWQVVKDNAVPHDIQVLIGERFEKHFGVE